MEPIYTQTFEITDNMVDCYGKLRASQILFIAQDMGGRHCTQLALDLIRWPATAFSGR